MEAALARACASETIVDTRRPELYAAGHLAGASSFPLAELPVRSSELPPATAAGLWIVADPGELEPALAILNPSELRPTEPVAAATATTAVTASAAAASATTAAAKGWRILGTLCASPVLWEAAAAQGLLERGATSRRLWSPSPHLPQVADMLEQGRPALEARRAVDLGCGKGRDAVYLAARGWHVVGVDNQSAFLQHALAFAARQGVGGRVATELLDLRVHRAGCVPRLRALLAPPLALVGVARFMSRALLDAVVEAMPVGCCLAVHHFCAGAKSLKSGRPIKGGNPDVRGLEPGELAARYAGVLAVLLDEESRTVEGRPLLSYVGRKLAPPTAPPAASPAAPPAASPAAPPAAPPAASSSLTAAPAAATSAFTEGVEHAIGELTIR